jgi:V8-like Glu-specific endopeptidase
MMKIPAKLLLLVILAFSSSLFADEGMWLMNQINKLDLEKKGLEMDVDDIYSDDDEALVNAIVWLGGCSASFVSDNGLILTNHHCAYGALQRASADRQKENPDINFIRDGFLAKDKSDEIQAIGQNAYVLEKMEDVTDDILDPVEDIKDVLERGKKIQELTAAMVKKIEGDREDIMARVVPMFKGKEYHLYVYKKYQDVRIVYAPPGAIGKYGGDIDNWMWPRHTGDFTFLRVYQSPDGEGAKYSPDNVPVKPKRYLKVAQKPLRDGDFTFIIGFPGSTTRWRTSNSVQWNLEKNYPRTIRNYGEVITIIDEFGAENPQAKVKLANLRAGLANTQKNFQGKVEGMTKGNFLGLKRQFESELMQHINKSEALKSKYGSVLDDIEALYDALGQNKNLDDALSDFGFLGGTVISISNQLYGVSAELEKPEADKDPSFNIKTAERTFDNIERRFLSYYEPFDKKMLKRALNNALAADSKAIDESLAFVKKEGVDAFVERAYKETKMNNPEQIKALFKKPTKELLDSGDPMLKLAAAMYPLIEEFGDRNQDFGTQITDLRNQYMNALYEWKGASIYPDANSTMRFTYGPVRGYYPRDAVYYKPFTTLSGVIEKHTGEDPFDNPAKLAELHQAKDFGKWVDPKYDDVVVAFTHMCDITGGNSGSAVMNARGELIGLAFDGNYEAMTGDWQYNYDLQRTISVDIRYVMFVTEKFAGADYILEEMNLD